MPEPIYTLANCSAAYQLRWSLALFARQDLPSPTSWFESLRQATERDDIRLLDFHFEPPDVWFFLISTQPQVIPAQIAKSVKGRLQHLVQQSVPQAFRRNFSLTSLGAAKREVVEQYVAGQLGHHRMADANVQQIFSDFQLSFPEVDLREPTFSSHGRYLLNLHLVLVNENRFMEADRASLEQTRDMILRVVSKGHRLSRLSLFADHLHLTLGFQYDESPADVALGYLNNLAFAHGMKAVHAFGYYVGTFGEYDMGVVWRGA